MSLAATLLLITTALPPASAVDLRRLLGEPFQSFDQALGEPEKVENLRSRALGEARHYRPRDPRILAIVAYTNAHDLVPDAVQVLFREKAVLSWKQALQIVGFDVPGTARLSKGGKQLTAGDFVVGMPGIGATVYWYPVTSSGKREPKLDFKLSRPAIEAGNRRFAQKLARGEVSRPSLQPDKASVPPGTPPALIPPAVLTRERASRVLRPVDSGLVLAKGFETSSTFWRSGGPGSRLSWHAYPTPVGPFESDLSLRLATTGDATIRSDSYEVTIQSDGALRLNHYGNIAETSIAARLGKPFHLQISLKNKRYYVLIDGVVVGEVPYATGSGFPHALEFVQGPAGTSTISDLMWRTAGYRDAVGRAPRTAPAFARLGHRMGHLQVGKVLGVQAHFDEGWNASGSRFEVYRYAIPGLGYFRGAFRDGRLESGDFIFRTRLSHSEAIRALGLARATWTPIPTSDSRDWTASFIRQGRTPDGAAIAFELDGAKLSIDWGKPQAR